jgi:hypothetical protein
MADTKTSVAHIQVGNVVFEKGIKLTQVVTGATTQHQKS